MNSSEQEELLFIGDVHLGRRPVRLDGPLFDLGISADDLGPQAALARTVCSAIESPPRAVVFAGDLVDQEKDRFEALWILEREARRLAQAGIPVLAIAGNHDSRILPRLIRSVPSVQLLGKAARWERYAVPGPGREVDLFGWSFPQRHFFDCPLDHGDFPTALASARPGATRLGVLHADLDASSSNYAPVSRTRLANAGLDAWLLGHEHKPSLFNGPQPIGYLGSLVGLHARETGPRGAWRVHCSENAITMRQIDLGPVRWAELEVPITKNDAGDEFAVRARIVATLQDYADAEALINNHHVLVARVRLTGALPERAAISEFVRVTSGAPQLMEVGLPVILAQVTDETRTAVPLDQIATETTPIGQIARELLAFQSTGEVPAEARVAFAEVRDGDWHLDDDADPMPAIEVLFERAAWRTLDELLAQEKERRS